MLCKAVRSFCALFLYMYCLGVLCIISLYGAPSLNKPAHLQVLFSLHCGITRRSCTLKTITLTYYKNYTFIYSNTTVTATYWYINITYLNLVLGALLTHLYLLSACIQVSKVLSQKSGSKSRAPVHLNSGLSTYIDRQE